jgi:hypothetical protein
MEGKSASQYPAIYFKIIGTLVADGTKQSGASAITLSGSDVYSGLRRICSQILEKWDVLPADE